jgi:hypothetical protein
MFPKRRRGQHSGHGALRDRRDVAVNQSPGMRPGSTRHLPLAPPEHAPALPLCAGHGRRAPGICAPPSSRSQWTGAAESAAGLTLPADYEQRRGVRPRHLL